MKMSHYLKDFLLQNKDLLEDENFEALFDEYNVYFRGHPTYLINDEDPSTLNKQELLNCLLGCLPLEYILSKMTRIPDFTFTFYQEPEVYIPDNIKSADQEAFYSYEGKISFPHDIMYNSTLDKLIGVDPEKITIRP
jgi:hypothetical protein